METVTIKEEFITLGQLLKATDCIATGGQAKAFLQNTHVSVNGEPENRRGRKLYPGDIVEVQGCGAYKVGKAP